MKKTILTLVMMLMVALATQTAMAVPMTKADSVINAKMQGVERVKEKIDQTLDDTIATGDRDGWAVEMAKDSDMTPEQIEAISDRWARVVEVVATASIFGLLVLILLVLSFRFLNRRSKYRVIEKAIINNYPLNELSLNDCKHSAIYVQQPVVTAAPLQPGQVTVGTPIQGQTPDNPIVMTDMVNWRALTPALKWLGWGVGLFFCGVAIGSANPFTPVGLALIFVGVCKGYILYKEQKALQEAWNRAGRMQPREPMREGIPVPPPMNDYTSDHSAND